ncbi:uncharacterized protein E0L32_011621 [Thyridium curvatum]|uniref:Amidohydrolase 3 domain-containing protein n=1 Tax=Thyridium curvatum TaxID=1093900 RepID=A0A507BNY6_9PEZI|nr:uncharacterized protein E0L32_011621 [Thyridium curvatum]TPX18508.1 hypothetical protein E0L32_011621 [Thyridium curvatum]
MDHDKGGLPPYSAVGDSSSSPRWRELRQRRMRRSRAFKLVGLGALLFIVYAQWTQLSQSRIPSTRLSLARLQQDLETCKTLRHKPQDPIGLGRERNARYVEGIKPTLIQNATVWVGEPVEGTPADQARNGSGYAWITADVFVQQGLIMRVESKISPASLPKDTVCWDAKGRQLTSGIVDMHSHAGVDPLPGLVGDDDTNEMSADTTPYVRSIDGIKPLDHQIQVIKSGGVTTSLVLPGSGNNIGGEAYVIKHAVGSQDGRPELSVADMLADPDRNWRYMKMACGENAKRVYGKVGEHGPVSRLGESWEFRHAFEQAAEIVRAQDDWCDAAEALGVDKMDTYLPQEIRWESLGAVLRGQVHVNTHCYTIPDLEAFVDHTNEFKFPLRAFHHAHQTFLVPEILKRTWGGAPASALFADNMYYKAEAYIGSEYAGKFLWDEGLTPVYVSDNPVLNAQHVVFEAAKGYRYGLPYHVALASVTTAPAERLGLGQRIGKIKPGFDADIVVWDSDPLSVGAAPVQVWIDGTAQFEDPVELDKPLTAPIVPNEDLSDIPEEELKLENVVFTGVSKVLINGQNIASDNGNLNVAISNGRVTCIGPCGDALLAASKPGSDSRVILLRDGHITPSYTAFGSSLGLNEIDMEADTDNGPSGDAFTRGLDGLALDGKKLHVAHKYGVTRAISAPKLSGQMTHRGTSVGFLTGAATALDKGAVFADNAAVHYTLSLDAKSDKTPSISGLVGALRRALLEAVRSNETTVADPYSEAAQLRKVVAGEKALVLTVHSADVIAAALRVKAEVEREAGTTLRVVILGGAEAHLMAGELKAAGVGVVLAPAQSYRATWDQRRALTGAPLTNGTAVDALVREGVAVSLGLEEDWLVRDMGLLAGIAWRNGEGRLTEEEALGLVAGNIYKMLGLERSEEDESGHFVISEGSPLDIASRVKAVGGGLGYVSVYM